MTVRCVTSCVAIWDIDSERGRNIKRNKNFRHNNLDNVPYSSFFDRYPRHKFGQGQSKHEEKTGKKIENFVAMTSFSRTKVQTANNKILKFSFVIYPFLWYKLRCPSSVFSSSSSSS